MDKKTEALKLALEALEVATTPLAKDRQEVLRAQAAIREALAEQPAQQQEPVAWTLLLVGEHHGLVGKAGEKFVGHPEYYERVDVFKSPPASKPWVGLTGHEQKALMSMNVRDAVFKAEQMLKERNT